MVQDAARIANEQDRVPLWQAVSSRQRLTGGKDGGGLVSAAAAKRRLRLAKVKVRAGAAGGREAEGGEAGVEPRRVRCRGGAGSFAAQLGAKHRDRHRRGRGDAVLGRAAAAKAVGSSSAGGGGGAAQARQRPPAQHELRRRAQHGEAVVLEEGGEAEDAVHALRSHGLREGGGGAGAGGGSQGPSVQLMLLRLPR